MDDFILFVLVGFSVLLFFCVGLPVILAYRLAMRAMELEDD